MKQEPKASPRAIALLLAAVALPATPALAQDIAPLPTAAQPAPVTTAVTPPPIVSTAPTPPPVAPTSVTPPPVVRTTPTVEAAAPETAPAARAVPRAQNRARPAPARRAASIAEVAPVAAAPVAPAPVAPAPVIEPVAPPAAAPAAPVQTTAPAERGAPIWPWVLGGLAVLAGLIGLIVSRRRRAADALYYEDAVYEEPVETVALDAAPLAAIAEPELVPTDETVAQRPWIELGMRPVRAGTQEDDAVVEFELTVANAGSVAAEDVRISTWMFTADPTQSENERQMIDPPAASALTEMDLAPGDGRTVDATIALPKAGLHLTHGAQGDSFVPVVGAEARYRLPDGSEGLISASFAIGVSQEDGTDMAPFAADGAPDMQENVEARLYGVLERA